MRAREGRATWAGTLSRNTIYPKAANVCCQVRLGRRRMPGRVTMAMAIHTLQLVIQGQKPAGSQVETTSYQARSGASSWAVLRANRRFMRAASLKGSSQRACSQARTAGPVRPWSHSATPRFWRVPDAGSEPADFAKAVAAAG